MYVKATYEPSILSNKVRESGLCNKLPQWEKFSIETIEQLPHPVYRDESLFSLSGQAEQAGSQRVRSACLLVIRIAYTNPGKKSFLIWFGSICRFLSMRSEARTISGGPER